MLSNKKILVTNDDGLYAIGIKQLVSELTHIYNKEDIVIVAPKSEYSCVSHSLTIHKPMKLLKETDLIEGVCTYSLTGTPADCVKCAICYLGIKPELIYSGVNNGLNLGYDILYSGTCAAGFEASIADYKTICLSAPVGFGHLVSTLKNVLLYINNNELLKNESILNVNIPINVDVNNPSIIKTVQGKEAFSTLFRVEDGYIYNEGNPITNFSKEDDLSDLRWNQLGYITITPLTAKRTNN